MNRDKPRCTPLPSRMLRAFRSRGLCALTIALATSVGVGCVDGRAKLSHRVAWDQQLNLPGTEEFPELLPPPLVRAVVMDHENEAAALGLDLSGVNDADSLLLAIEAVWFELDANGRMLFQSIFLDLFEIAHTTALDEINSRFTEGIGGPVYVGIDMRDFAQNGSQRSVDGVTELFDAGEFKLDLEALTLDTLGASSVAINIAVHVGNVDELLAMSGFAINGPSNYVKQAVLRSIGVRTVRESDLYGDGDVDLNRVTSSFRVATGCQGSQSPLDWLHAYKIQFTRGRAAYPEDYGFIWLITEDPPDDAPENSWSVVASGKGLNAVPDAPPICGIADAGPENEYSGDDITPFVTSPNGFTLEVLLSGTHTFGDLDLIEKTQVMLEVGK